ncbi:radical SAM/SPASM domain-containing protein [Acidianus brierleyi]|uniref:Radical SAM/SPASM domain-containing protein n=1 Tax=Acidianus brierleyi TaxID=41673 RepID=A0A2U9IHZ7_9CREN|nr:radical SAM protein [Acidianus brierleyi]AWR95673.1 radical SAM protein [Acidianus brierleyi]
MINSKPFFIELELTYRCSQQCFYCHNPPKEGNFYIANEKPKFRSTIEIKELDVNEWLLIIDQIKNMDKSYEGAMDIVITGGEALLRTDLEEILSYISRQKLRYLLLTSGEPVSDNRIKKLVESGLDRVRINLTSHKHLSDLSVLDMNIKNEILNKTNIAKKFKYFGVKLVGGNIVLTKYYLDHLEEVVDLAYKANLDWIEINPVIKVGHGYINQKYVVPDSNDEKKIHDKLNRLRSIYGEDFIQNYVDTDILYSRIPIPTNWGEIGLIVSPNGDVYPGSEATSIPLAKLGNLKTHSLIEIWSNNRLLNAIRTLSFLKEPCKSCTVKNICKGGFRFNAYILGHDLLAPDPLCPIVKNYAKGDLLSYKG